MVYEYLLPVDRRSIINFPHGSLQPVVNLLRTNRQFYAELVQVVYGGITFVLTVDPETIAWLKGIGSMKRFIRHIHIVLICGAKLVSFFHQLKQANDLRSLTVDTDCLPGPSAGHNPEQMARALAPLFKTLQKARRGVHDKSDIVRIFSAAPPPKRFTPEELRSWRADYESGCATAETVYILKWLKTYTDYTESVRAKLDEILP